MPSKEKKQKEVLKLRIKKNPFIPEKVKEVLVEKIGRMPEDRLEEMEKEITGFEKKTADILNGARKKLRDI